MAEEILRLKQELNELSQEEKELLQKQELEELRRKVEEKKKVVQALKGHFTFQNKKSLAMIRTYNNKIPHPTSKKESRLGS